MNYSLLEDENYFNDLKQKVPEWKAEGERMLPNKRSVWDWIKYNIRAHAILQTYKKVTSRRFHNNRAIEYSVGTKTLLSGSVQNQDRGRRD